MTKPSDRPVCVVLGVGPGSGEALARRFALAGHSVALLARRRLLTERLASELPDARAVECDVTDVRAVTEAFAYVAAEMGMIETLIYNVGRGVRGSVDQVSTTDFEQSWRINALGLFHCARQVIPQMKERGRGNIVVIGATASRRGVAGTAAFAPAKMAQRALAESMARHLGPAGIHVSLIVVDGVIGCPETGGRLADRTPSSFIDPDAIAATALGLTRQDRSAWSFEVDVRPFNERW